MEKTGKIIAVGPEDIIFLDEAFAAIVSDVEGSVKFFKIKIRIGKAGLPYPAETSF
jgi:hypothetical protein